MLSPNPIPRSLLRYADTIRELEGYPIETGKILLYGSSFFRNWGYDRARRQLEDASGGSLLCINHGFGGATNDDLLYYYHRMVRPYAPKAIILRTGVNDIFKGYAPEEAVFLLQRLIEWAKADDGQVQIFVLGIFDVKRFTAEEQMQAREYNLRCQALAGKYDGVSYLDLNPFFYDREEDMGRLEKLRDVFLEDGLHLTDAGYEEMAVCFAGQIQALLEETKKAL